MPMTPTTDIDRDHLATLREIGRFGSSRAETTPTSRRLARRVDVDHDTIARRLDRLERAGLVSLYPSEEGRQVGLTPSGRERVAADGNGKPSSDRDAIELRGSVTEGLGKGREFVSLEGYAEQFERRLGYEPYPGTLNVSLDSENTARRSLLTDVEGIRIDPWERGERTFGGATCYPVRLETATGDSYAPAHLLVPDRTDHGSDQLEIIAADRLRSRLDIDDDEVISIHVRR